MIRPSTLLWLAAVVAIGYAMFQVKYQVMQQERQLATLNHQIVAGRDAIRVLDAEWSFLSQPTRLDDLQKRYLTLVPIGTAQLLSNIDDLPMRGVGASAPVATSSVSRPAEKPFNAAGLPRRTRLATLNASVE